MQESPVDLESVRRRNSAVKLICEHLHAAVVSERFDRNLVTAFRILRVLGATDRVRQLSPLQSGELLAALAHVHRGLVPRLESAAHRTALYLNAAATIVLSWRGDPAWPHDCAGVCDARDLLAAADCEFTAVVLINAVAARNSPQREEHVSTPSSGVPS